VVTIRHGVFDPVTIARGVLEADPTFFRHGVSAVIYALADAVVDRYESACDEIESSVDDIEALVFAPGSKNAAELIFQQKRSTLTFVRNVAPLVDVIGRLATHRAVFETSDAIAPYFRDVSDHLARVQSRLDQSRELLTAALEANLAQISIRQNEDMRAMSGWAAIIAVPTLFAGIWGMNFQHMPELNTFWGYPLALATIVASSYGAYRRLKRNGWM
jgi:magnesium transporter